jgi:hypothetical protein
LTRFDTGAVPMVDIADYLFIEGNYLRVACVKQVQAFFGSGWRPRSPKAVAAFATA